MDWLNNKVFEISVVIISIAKALENWHAKAFPDKIKHPIALS